MLKEHRVNHPVLVFIDSSFMTVRLARRYLDVWGEQAVSPGETPGRMSGSENLRISCWSLAVHSSMTYTKNQARTL